MWLCGAADLLPSNHHHFTHSHDPSNYLNGQIGKGRVIVLLLRQFTPPSLYTLYDSLYLFIFIHSIHLYGITRLRRQDDSFIADAVCQRRSVVSGVPCFITRGAWSAQTRPTEKTKHYIPPATTTSLSTNLMITVSLSMSNKSCFEPVMPR